MELSTPLVAPAPATAPSTGSKEAASTPTMAHPPLSYPVEDTGWDATTFIRQTAEVLRNPRTAIYVDTSFLMWLTKGGEDSRQQFIEWAGSLGDRIHVPVWTYHEYYRHHSHDTLRGELDEEKKRLLEATNRYVALARTYADDPFMPQFSATAFHRELEELLDKVKSVTNTAAQWNYAKAARQISDWMAQRLCRSKVVFDLMDKLGQLGQTRYTQDLPPGYRDRIKEDSEKKGSNKFGDLILWEEVLAHVAGTPSTQTVVVLTRDRKDDWFAKAKQAEVDDALRRLTGKARWNPVPAPHPTLVLELRARTHAADLVLLDSLYLGATLHHVADANRSRLIAYALGISPASYTPSAPQEAQPVAARVSDQPISKRLARSTFAAASASSGLAAPSASVTALMERLMGEVPAGEAFVEQFSYEQLPDNLDEAAAFARRVADAALQDAMHLPRQMVDKLLVLLPIMPADKAAAVYAGMLASAYFDDTGPRDVPSAWRLQVVFDQMSDPAYEPVLQVTGEGLRAAGSAAVFIPSSKSPRLPVRVTLDSEQEQTPLALKQVSVGERNLLTTMGPALPSNLSRVFEQDSISVDELVRRVVERYGLPEAWLEIDGVAASDRATVPVSLGFIDPRDSETVQEAEDTPSDAELEAVALETMAALDDEELDAQAYLNGDLDE